MKRELKPGWIMDTRFRACLHCRAYPDEKGIETVVVPGGGVIAGDIAEPIPMKRELKPESPAATSIGSRAIAEPIPMKRELKLFQPDTIVPRLQYCRAYPDEKGIETMTYSSQPITAWSWIAEPIPMKRELKRPCHAAREIRMCDCRAYPDEKGIETVSIWLVKIVMLSHCRAYPDEKGIETFH